MKSLKSTLMLIPLLILLAACNLSNTPAVITATPTPATRPAATLTQAPTLAGTPTFPAVITATPAPASATSSANLATATKSASPTTAPSPTTASSPTITATKGTPVKITGLRMLDVTSGWATGQYINATTDEILRTGDGGKTWKAITPPEPDRSGKKATAFFQDASRAWVNFAQQPGGATPTTFTIWRTTDGGATWKSSNTSLAGISNLESFYTSQIGFRDASNGWLMAILGAGMNHTYIAIYKTSDGGDTWSLIVSPDKNNVPMSCSKSGLWFRDANHGLLAGSCFGVMKGLYLYQTGDGGATWSLVNLPAPAALTDAYTRDGNACGAEAPQFFDDLKGILVVQCSDVNASKTYRWTYRTTNGGATWTSAALPRAWGGFYFLDLNTGWYLGQTAADANTGVAVYQTTNGGSNWKLISGTNWSGSMDYIDARNGWVIAKSGTDLALVRTSDGGVSYQILTPQLAP